MDALQLRIPPKQGKEFIATINKIVAENEHISIDKMLSKTRKREMVFARQMAMSFSKKLTYCTLLIIGTEIGEKSHATVLYACKTINNLTETDKYIQGKYNSLYFKIINEIPERFFNIYICPFCKSENIFRFALKGINTDKLLEGGSNSDVLCRDCGKTNFNPEKKQ